MDTIILPVFLEVLGAVCFTTSGARMGYRKGFGLWSNWTDHFWDIALCVAGFMLFHAADRF